MFNEEQLGMTYDVTTIHNSDEKEGPKKENTIDELRSCASPSGFIHEPREVIFVRGSLLSR
jgi:hypothetical protein